MSRLQSHIIKALMVISLLLLPGGFVQCDTPAGYLDIGVDGIEYYGYDGYYYDEYIYYDDYYYDDYYYDPWGDCCY